MPRNEPSRTKFEKYDKCTTLAPSQRISASSRNNIRKLDIEQAGDRAVVRILAIGFRYGESRPKEFGP